MNRFDRFTLRAVIFVAAWAVVLAAAPFAAAAEGSGKGVTTMTRTHSETFQLPNGESVEHSTSEGFSIGAEPDNPFRAVNFRCSSTSLVAADGASARSGGYCGGVDKDGDVFWLSIRGTQSAGKWRIAGGTGKFQGMEGGGTYVLGKTAWEDGKAINAWEGSWTMK